jgi:hypothetical protein
MMPAFRENSMKTGKNPFPLTDQLMSKYHDVMKSKDDKVKKDDRKSYPLRLPKATLKALKAKALDEDSSVQKILERLIAAYLADETETP